MIPKPSRPTSRWSVVLAAFALLALAGCGGSPGETGGGGGGGAQGEENRIAGDQFRLSGTQKTAQFIVGSEGFTEQQVLGAITTRALEAADATVIDRTGLGGNEAVRQALLDEEIDLSWEDTATG